MSALSILDISAVRAAPVSREPYAYTLGSNVLNPEAIDDIRRDFPDIAKPGYLTVDEVTLKGRFKALIDELESDAFSKILGEKFGIDLVSCPRLTTIMRRSQLKYGSIHTDGPSKVLTLLVYMNDAWDAPAAGRLRVLYDGRNSSPSRWRSRRPWARCSPSCGRTIPGTATSPSRASGAWCRWRGSRTPRSWSASASATVRRSS